MSPIEFTSINVCLALSLSDLAACTSSLPSEVYTGLEASLSM